MPVVLIATLDTKGVEAGYIRDRLVGTGCEVLLLDAGILDSAVIPADIPRTAVLAAAGTTLEAVQEAGDRGQAVSFAATGTANIVRELHRQGRVSGIISLGGSAGTTIGTAAMRELPLGIPKLMVSTLASGQVQHYVGTSDILMMHSVVDLSGLNRISRAVLDNAAAAMAGMVRHHPPIERTTDRPLVAATMFGVTTPCVEGAKRLLDEAGYEVMVFHATGTGGRTMERLIREGNFAGVLDITTTELADELVGGILSAGPERLTAAGLAGVPQVISVGALDMVNFGPADTVPAKFKGRTFYQHNANVTLMRTTPLELGMLGAEIAHKANSSRGPTSIVLPMKGISAIDADGKPFWWPEADAILFEAIRGNIAPNVTVLPLEHHINDPDFATACAQELLRLMALTPSATLSH